MKLSKYWHGIIPVLMIMPGYSSIKIRSFIIKSIADLETMVFGWVLFVCFSSWICRLNVFYSLFFSGKTLPLVILTTFFVALIIFCLVATATFFALYQAYKKIKYVFFPSCQPPLNIEVGWKTWVFIYLADVLLEKWTGYSMEKVFICYPVVLWVCLD